MAQADITPIHSDAKMLFRYRLASLVPILLFLVMQTYSLAHVIEHDWAHEAHDTHEKTVCDFCIAIKGKNSTASGPVSNNPPLKNSWREYRPKYASVTFINANAVEPRQQGPPQIS